MAHRFDELATSVDMTLKSKASNVQYYSLALDENTDAPQNPSDLFKSVITTLNRLGQNLTNLSDVITDGAPAMEGRGEELVELMQEEVTKNGINNVMKYYFLIHQEKLCAKSLKAESVIRVVVNVVNSILSKGLNHREFQDFLHNLETEFRDVVYYSEVRWLSRGKMLKRMFDLKEGGQTFAEGKGKRVAEFNDDEWMCDFAFIVDITIHLNELNTRLHGKGQLINSTSDHVEAFKMKLRLWESQLKNNNFVHIPILLKCNGRDSQKYVRIISELREEFDTRFQVFKTLVSVCLILRSPFV
ncbi:hypothetical protein Cfor_05726 [Coptotermes formosanus]|uniref:Uncharacterized protein n=1 Tax=Coptotermes formosanus TaxID=36987 RepID=A0A6L2PWQ1_COPFO|nr:hypothetical protein Cfor_05726 [Coptotermes formosanus]